jgi:hypothetical protein
LSSGTARAGAAAAARTDLTRAAAGLTRTAAARRWRGPDPYDGLWWSWPRPLVGGRRRRQVFMQLHARSPFDVRRLYRRSHPLIPKALGIFGSVCARLHRIDPAGSYDELARDALGTLDADRTSGNPAWGYHWDMQTRWSFYPAGSSNVVVTAFAVRGLTEGAETLGEPGWAERAARAAEWVAEELYAPEGFYRYHPGSDSVIHNASLLGARTAYEHDPSAAREAAARAVERTLAGQRADGAWPYGEGSNLGFVDSFHTGYVLSCLCDLRELDPAIDAALRRGTDYYVERFFGADGWTPLWPTRRYPEDAHSAGTGMTSLATLVRAGYADADVLRRVADRVVAHKLRDGHVVHRRGRLVRSTVRYLRWCDAHVALGLTDAALALAGSAPSAGPGR